MSSTGVTFSVYTEDFASQLDSTSCLRQPYSAPWGFTTDNAGNFLESVGPMLTQAEWGHVFSKSRPKVTLKF